MIITKTETKTVTVKIDKAKMIEFMDFNEEDYGETFEEFIKDYIEEYETDDLWYADNIELIDCDTHTEVSIQKKER